MVDYLSNIITSQIRKEFYFIFMYVLKKVLTVIQHLIACCAVAWLPKLILPVIVGSQATHLFQ